MREKAVMKTISSSNVLIVGLARNCQDTIEREVQIINSAFSEAKAVNWLVIESDSDDETLTTLKKLSNNVEFAFITLGKLRKQYPKRTERIAVCRNRYLQELRVNKSYDNIDYVVVADLDGVNSELTKTAVKSCWKFTMEWDACFANQSKVYYDIWALRHKTWCPNDCWQTYKFFLNHGVGKHRALHAAVYSRMINLDSNEDPIEVNSAFGGLGIYKKHAILSAAYVGLDDNEEEICEHVNLHAMMRGKGLRLYIIPSLINCGWIEHSKNLQFTTRIRDSLRYSIKEFFTNSSS
jgi:hypothetical protein